MCTFRFQVQVLEKWSRLKSATASTLSTKVFCSASWSMRLRNRRRFLALRQNKCWYQSQKSRTKPVSFFSDVDLFGKLYIIFWQNKVCWSLERFLFWRNLHFCFQPSRFGNGAILNFWLALSKTFTLNFFSLPLAVESQLQFQRLHFFHKDSNGRTNDVINGIESCEKQLFLLSLIRNFVAHENEVQVTKMTLFSRLNSKSRNGKEEDFYFF